MKLVRMIAFSDEELKVLTAAHLAPGTEAIDANQLIGWRKAIAKARKFPWKPDAAERMEKILDAADATLLNAMRIVAWPRLGAS